jgi:lipopolysaccharide export LptBFGC system permease protein LptF
MYSQDHIHDEQLISIPHDATATQENLSPPTQVQNQSQQSTSSDSAYSIHNRLISSFNSTTVTRDERSYLVKLWDSTKTYLLCPFLIAMSASIGLSVGKFSFLSFTLIFFPLL